MVARLLYIGPKSSNPSKPDTYQTRSRLPIRASKEIEIEGDRERDQPRLPQTRIALPIRVSRKRGIEREREREIQCERQ